DDARADDQQTNPDHPREDRHEDPVDDVGDELALAPPWRTLVAGPEVGEHGKHERKDNGDRHHFLDGLAKHHDHLHGYAGHAASVNLRRTKGYSAPIKEV